MPLQEVAESLTSCAKTPKKAAQSVRDSAPQATSTADHQTHQGIAFVGEAADVTALVDDKRHALGANCLVLAQRRAEGLWGQIGKGNAPRRAHGLLQEHRQLHPALHALQHTRWLACSNGVGDAN